MSDNIPSNFIHQIIDGDLASGKHARVVTRFPPEPNGYLHIGHAKSVCLNFGTALKYGGQCHLRYDDTNPEAEDIEFVRSIPEDIKWLGFDWGDNLFYASDYFPQMAALAEKLIDMGKAYICELSQEEFKEYRGVPTRPGKEPPGRRRSVAENRDLFARMCGGEFEEGRYVLRARIDMTSPNIHLRDPAIYRIKKAHHHRQGDTWCVYPMYDFAHCLEDSIEGITHSICTLEFEVHRPLYDWLLETLALPCHPQQIEFARLNLTYTVMSKRKLKQLVLEGKVDGWDDPRMPTLAGMRRRGYPPAAIREFCERVGVTKVESVTDVALLEFCVREELNKTAARRMAVLNPLKVVIDNFPEGEDLALEAVNNPENPAEGSRNIVLSKTLYIERDDFMMDPPKKFFRLAPGREVRLRYACLFTCTDVIKDDKGEVIEVHGTWDPQSKGGNAPDGRTVKGTIHWVSEQHAVKVPVRLYDRLFRVEDPLADDAKDFTEFLNPDSRKDVTAFAEPALATATAGERFQFEPYQFERLGYFRADPKDSSPGKPVFNRIVPLRDSWGKLAEK